MIGKDRPVRSLADNFAQLECGEVDDFFFGYEVVLRSVWTIHHPSLNWSMGPGSVPCVVMARVDAFSCIIRERGRVVLPYTTART